MGVGVHSMDAMWMGQLIRALKEGLAEGREQVSGLRGGPGQRAQPPQKTAFGGNTCDHKRHKVKLDGCARPRCPG